jgi:membrane-associated protein
VAGPSDGARASNRLIADEINIVVNEIIDWLLNTVQGVDPVVRTLLAGVGILLETSILIGLIVPGDTVVLVASTGVSSPLEYVALVLAVIVGALCGESIGFALGKFFGPKIRASRLGRRIGERSWTRANNYVDRRGGIAVFLSRFLPIFHSLVPVTVGMSTMRYRRFIGWTAPACLVWALIYVSIGAFAAGGYRSLDKSLNLAGFLFLAVVALSLVAVLVVRRQLARSQERHMDQPSDGDAN